LVSCSDTAAGTEMNPHWHSAVSAQVTSISDELYCSADVRVVTVRPRQSTPLPTAWDESRERIDFKLVLLVCRAALSYLSNELSQPADLEGRHRQHRLRSTSSPSLIVRCTWLSAISWCICIIGQCAGVRLMCQCGRCINYPYPSRRYSGDAAAISLVPHQYH